MDQNNILYCLYEGGIDFVKCCDLLQIDYRNRYDRFKARNTINLYLDKNITPDPTGKKHPILLLDKRQCKELIELLQMEALSGKQSFSNNNGPAVW